jgi:hypothetical protein
MDSAWVGALAASIAVPVAFAILRRFFPLPRGLETDRSLADLRQEYGRFELLSLPLLLALAPAATYLWWRLFLALATDSGFSHAAGVHALRPPRIAWLLPALLLGILSAGPAIEAILRRLLGERWREYVAYTNLRHGFDSEAIEKPFYFAFGGLAAVGAFLIANWYVLFTPSEIRLNPFFAVRERVFAYTDLVAIRTAPAFVAPNGKTVRRREYVLRFSDASAWNTTWDPSEATEGELRSLVQWVSERSGVSIEEAPLLAREELR